MRRVIRKRIRRKGQGIDLVADVNAAISINEGGAGERTETHTSSHQRVVQDSRRTEDEAPERAREKED
ncbi:MAG: hypothetical protein M3155_07650 [Actinomycetota bacterium]|nr:hypothetical protein [Actinomycetota bacterium]